MKKSAKNWDLVEALHMVGFTILMFGWFAFYYHIAEALRDEQTAKYTSETQQLVKLANGRLVDSTPRVEKVYSARAIAATESPQVKKGR